MGDLTTLWIAEFKDGTQLKQFGQQGENKFQLVLDRQSELKCFSLHNWSVNLLFTVDLEKGIIYCSTASSPSYISEESKSIVKSNIRLIYFRRVIETRQFNDLSKVNSTIYNFLGYQYTDSNGYNKKVILQIDKDGNFLIGE